MGLLCVAKGLQHTDESSRLMILGGQGLKGREGSGGSQARLEAADHSVPQQNDVGKPWLPSKNRQRELQFVLA